jgi:hypothetical protein
MQHLDASGLHVSVPFGLLCCGVRNVREVTVISGFLDFLVNSRRRLLHFRGVPPTLPPYDKRKNPDFLDFVSLSTSNHISKII